MSKLSTSLILAAIGLVLILLFPVGMVWFLGIVAVLVILAVFIPSFHVGLVSVLLAFGAALVFLMHWAQESLERYRRG